MSYQPKLLPCANPSEGCESLGCRAQRVLLKTGHPGTFEIQINKQTGEEGSLWYKYIPNILWNVLILKIVMVYMKFKCKWGISFYFLNLGTLRGVGMWEWPKGILSGKSRG